MPLLTLHLLRLRPSSLPLEAFLSRLSVTPGVKVILASEPQGIVITPQSLDKDILTSEPWEVLLLLSTPNAAIPSAFRAAISQEYKVCCGISSKLLATFSERSAELKKQAPQLTGSLDRALQERNTKGGEKLELSEDLLKLMEKLEKKFGQRRPLTMLNLLHFNWPGGKESYFQYGQGFKRVAASRGGDAKIVGNVVPVPEGVEDSRDERREKEEWWNEISLVHYPSIRSFCDMLAGEDYQEVNSKHRLAALKDTFLLCTAETLLEPSSPSEWKL